jgi:DNA (cytosine-5)-methyltransferase 1
MNGSRLIDEPMNNLVFEVLRFIRVFQPRAVMLENVPGLLSDARLTRFHAALRRLGYQSVAKIFDAADFGIPQRRRRMILVASKGTAPSFAEADEQRVTVRDAIGKLALPQNSNDVAHNYKVSHTKQTRSIIAGIPRNGGSRSSLPSKLQLDCHKRSEGFRDVYGRMKWSAPAPTVTGGCINPSKGRFLHPSQNRAITLREAALLQGFPPTYDFDLSCGRYPAAQLIGNAFPPAFAERHARVLRKHLQKFCSP